MSRSSDLNVPVTHNLVTAVIDHGCEFEGKLCFHGTVRIGGTFRGEIYTPDTLIIGEGARVDAQIEAGTIIISGEVNGSLRAKHRVEIHRPAIFRGDILTPSLSVDEGVIFDGSSKMAHTPSSPVRSFLTSKS
jgi:cytoskeletal protein CcmA (bactofilin family)